MGAAELRTESASRLDEALPATLAVRVAALTVLAPDILGVELRAAGHGALPPFTAGAHIDVHLPNGVSRSYSLVNSPRETHRYEIAVKRETGGRGGSAFVHDILRLDDVLAIGSPRNNFVLDEEAPYSVLFAGGIGVTPMLAMADRLVALGRPFELHYGVRSRADAAFLDRLAPYAERPGTVVRVWPDDELVGRRIDMRAVAGRTPEHTHFYCCGPAPMIAAFEASLAHLPPTRLHREHFSGAAELGEQGGFDVVLARSGRVLRVPEGETVLDTLLDAGVRVDFSCMEGFCGSCRTRVIEGTPVHKDTVLSAAERASGTVMLVCCSTVEGRRLVLDL